MAEERTDCGKAVLASADLLGSAEGWGRRAGARGRGPAQPRGCTGHGKGVGCRGRPPRRI